MEHPSSLGFVAGAMIAAQLASDSAGGVMAGGLWSLRRGSHC